MNKRFIRSWHRRLGLFSSLFVIWLALSGLLLNHSDKIGLNTVFSNGPLVKALYGLGSESDVEVKGYQFVDYYFVLDDRFYQNKKSELTCHGGIKNAVQFSGQLVFLCEESLLLFSSEGQFVDKIALSLLAVKVDDVAIVQDQNQQQGFIIISGNKHFRLDLLSLALTPLQQKPQINSPLSKQNIPPQVFAHVENNRFEGISIEKIILDAHSGRLFGNGGVYLVDLFALIFVIMAISGIYLFGWSKNKT